jgi:hypothetical protein
MTNTNKRLLISESRGDSNRCTPCKGKPDQHDTYTSHASPRTSDVRFLWAVLVRGNLPRVTDRVGQSHCSWEKGLPTQSTARLLTDPRVHTQFLSWANNAVVKKVKHVSIAGYLAYRTHITGMWSIRSILAHGYQPLGIAITLSPPFPCECSTSPPRWHRQVSILSNINLQQ